MKRDYYCLNTYAGNGTMGISRRAFETIANVAANEVEGATVTSRKMRLFNIEHPVQASFRKDGKVELHIDVAIAKNASVKDVCLNIQEGVASAITMMCETVPFSIEVKVIAVK